MVVTRVPDHAVPYPLARINGRLSMRDDCLLIGDAVAFWPAGTGWSADRRAVTFGGDFEGAPPAAVGSTFRGGGGVYEPTDSLDGLLSTDDIELLENCMEKTGVDRLVLVYPGRA
ncbi:MAG: hypothetical protein JWO76_49 [Nocardioides sp.]|nr:hypothetical protein [Nocardioides sp.]